MSELTLTQRMANIFYSEEDIEKYLATIQELSHKQMAKLFRFAPAGHPYFAIPRVAEAFRQRFDKFGGMTADLSKEIGFVLEEALEK